MPGRPQDVAAVGRGGDDGAPKACVAHRVQVADRALIRLDAVLVDQPQDDLVLSVAEPIHRLSVGRVVGITSRQMDSARLQERLDALVARLAVDVLVVVVTRIEWNELLSAVLSPLLQVGVEHLLPGGGVDLRRLGEDAVQVEEACVHSVREPEHPREPTARRGRDAGATSPRLSGLSSYGRKTQQPWVWVRGCGYARTRSPGLAGAPTSAANPSRQLG